MTDTTPEALLDDDWLAAELAAVEEEINQLPPWAREIMDLSVAELAARCRIPGGDPR